MNREQLAEELDRQIEMLMMTSTSAPVAKAQSDGLLELAAELRMLPSDAFKSLLQEQLLERAASLDLSAGQSPAESNAFPLTTTEFTPSFSSREFAALPAACPAKLLGTGGWKPASRKAATTLSLSLRRLALSFGLKSARATRRRSPTSFFVLIRRSTSAWIRASSPM